MNWQPPEHLATLAPELETGARVFVKRPFKWYKLKCWFDRFACWVSRSKNGCYHGGKFWKHNGRAFVVEATFFRFSQPRPLALWIKERRGFLVYVEPRPAENDGPLLDTWGLPYDFAAIWAMLIDRISGRWIGRTNSKSKLKVFCLELILLAEGAADAFRANMRRFF